MTAIGLGTLVGIPVHSHRFCDNGAIPHFQFYQRLATDAGRVAWQRGKVWRSPGRVSTIVAAGGAGQRNRWFGYIHTPPLCTQLGVYLIAARAQTSGGLTDPYVKLGVSGGVGSVEYHYGNTLAVPADVPSEWGHAYRVLDCAPDTGYELEFSDHDNGRLVSGTVWTIGAPPDTANGYIDPGYAVGENIYDVDQQALAQLTTAQFNRAGATAWSWSADTAAGARTRTSATDINLIDNTSTAVTAATPGATLDLRNRNSSSVTTVACVLRARARVAGGAGGHIYLKNSAGTVLATLTITSTVAGWTSTTVNLPNTEAKYDLHFDGDGTNLITVDAVVLHEHA